MFKENNLAKGLLIALICIVGVGAILSLSPQVRAESEIQEKIAYVNMQKIFDNYPKDKIETTKAETQLKKEGQNLQKKLETELKQKLNQVTGEDKQKLIDQYNQKLKQLEQQLNQRYQKLVVKPILAEIDDMIKEIAAEEDIAIVLNKEVVMYGGHDLTPKVLEKINAKFEAEQQAEENKEENN
jgi:outer membrane protein